MISADQNLVSSLAATQHDIMTTWPRWMRSSDVREENFPEKWKFSDEILENFPDNFPRTIYVKKTNELVGIIVKY